MGRFKKLDELELIKRGNIFKHCLFTVIGLLLINVTLLELDIIFMSQRNIMLCIIMFIVSLFCSEMILNDIYPIGEKRQRFIYVFFGLYGITLAVLSFYEAVILKYPLIEDGILSDTITYAIASIFSMSVGITYICRMLYNKKHKEDNT